MPGRYFSSSTCLTVFMVGVVLAVLAGCSSRPKIKSGLTGEYDKIVVARADHVQPEETIQPDPVTLVRMGNQLLTVIQYFDVKPALQQRLVDVLRQEAKRTEGAFDGLISVNLHKSQDGRKVINYLQFASRASYESWRKSADFNEKVPVVRNNFVQVRHEVYEVVYIQH